MEREKGAVGVRRVVVNNGALATGSLLMSCKIHRKCICGLMVSRGKIRVDVYDPLTSYDIHVTLHDPNGHAMLLLVI